MKGKATRSPSALSHPPSHPRRRLGFVVALSCLVAPLPVGAAQEDAATPEADSVALVEEAKEEQKKFERYRERRLLPQGKGFGCDALVGRLCLRHGDGEAPPAPEPLEVEMARMEFLRTLSRIGARIPRDRWVLGQRVYYLREQGEWRRAKSLTSRCDPDGEWWCLALKGYLLQSRRESVEAEAVFRDAISRMPEEERRTWVAIDHLLDDDARELFKDADAAGQAALREQLWLLADPLYLVEGNDREAEQYARRTLIRIRESAENAYDIPWEEDLEELVARYGEELRWERVRPKRSAPGLERGRHLVQAALDGAAIRLRRGPILSVSGLSVDTRFIISRHQPHGREFLPAGAFLEDPAGIRVYAWEIEDRAPWTGYAPRYAPVITTMDAQVARFRRGDSLLVVAGYQPPPPPPPVEPVRLSMRDIAPGDDPFAVFDIAPPPPVNEPAGVVESGVFVLTPGGERLVDQRGSMREGVVTARVPDGGYIFGLEVLDEAGGRAWRARGGVRQGNLPFGLVGVSDVILLDAGGGLPESLDEALPRVLGSTRVRPGETLVAGWEVYGLRTGESAMVDITMQDARPGIVARATRFLRLTSPEAPLEMSWQEAGPDQRGTVFRAIALTLPELEPDEYDLILEVKLSGRNPIEVRKRLFVEEQREARPGGDAVRVAPSFFLRSPRPPPTPW